MRFLISLLFLFCFLSYSKAQQPHFVYIQTENKQAFYIKLNDKLISSSGNGFVIIPKLSEGEYSLNIGFPKNEWPIQSFTIKLNNMDEGFLLKNFGADGWRLFNLQSMEILKASVNSEIPDKSVQNRSDAFSNTLATVTNSTPMLHPEVSIQAVVPVIAATSVIVNANDSSKSYVNDTSVGKMMNENIKQVFSIIDHSGRSVIYSINNGVSVDSVRVFIPYYEMAADKIPSNPDTSVSKEMSDVDRSRSITSESIVIDSIIKPSASINAQPLKPVDAQPLIRDIVVSDKIENTVVITNPSCTSIATEGEYSKLQKKMMAAENDEDRIAVARKAMKTKCLTTNQVRELSSLFLNDEGKYNFFDVSYNHVSDREYFKTLQYLLTEEYYINRFKAMLH